MGTVQWGTEMSPNLARLIEFKGTLDSYLEEAGVLPDRVYVEADEFMELVCGYAEAALREPPIEANGYFAPYGVEVKVAPHEVRQIRIG